MKTKPKECCNTYCKNVFHLPSHEYFQKNVCDKCIESKNEKETILKGKEWGAYLRKNNLLKKKQEEIYVCTHNHIAIYKLGDYYFTFGITNGYKNLTSLKRLMR